MPWTIFFLHVQKRINLGDFSFFCQESTIIENKQDQNVY